MPNRWTRRAFLGAAGAAAAGTLAGGAARPPLGIAFVGVGGRGKSNLQGLAPGNRVVALCDVDDRQAAEAAAKFPGARRYRDYRKMLADLGGELDAVSISTPDHLHAAVALDAIGRSLPVYCEKPLAHSIHEVRLLTRAASAKGVVTQLGNQGHATDAIRRMVEAVRAGAVGAVHTVHAGCQSSYSRMKDLASVSGTVPVPAELDWDLWLGPVPERPYHPAYLPGKWRGWRAFGTGVIGDWTCHVLDPAFWALDLGAPESVEAVSVGDYDPVRHAETFPSGATIRYRFPAKAGRGPVTVYWHSGFDVQKMPRPEGLEAGKELPSTGAVLLGDKGAIVHGSHGAGGWRIVPPPGGKAPEPPPRSIPSAGDPYRDFQAAILEKRPAGSDFAAYGGPLTEVALLGTIAMAFPGRKLGWDAAAGRITDCPEADARVTPPFRKGWGL